MAAATETQAPELSPDELLTVIEFRIHEPEQEAAHA